jgi:hypothetical protein
MALDIVTEEKEENNTSQHVPAATVDIKIENLIISKTIGTGAEYYQNSCYITKCLYSMFIMRKTSSSRSPTHS